MTEPSVIKVVDADGKAHWTSSTSQWAVDGLADGSLKLPEEASHAATDAGAGDDHNPATVDGGPDDGAVDSTTTGRGGRRAGKTQPAAGS